MNRPISVRLVCLLLAALLLFCGLQASAQKATIRNGTILRDDTPYARIQTSGSLLDHRAFSFRTLDGKEFLMMHYDDAAGDYRLVFFPGEEETRLAARYGSASVMAQEIVDNNLVEDGALNPAGLKRFMLAHPANASPGAARAKRKPSGNSEKSTSETMREIDKDLEQAADDVSEAILNIGGAIERAFEKDSVRRAERRSKTIDDRNRSVPVMVRGSKLEQDGQLIGTYTAKSETKAGVAERIYSVYSAADGDLVAEVSMADQKPRSAEIITPQDNRMETLKLAGRTEQEVVAEIGTWLVKHRYL